MRSTTKYRLAMCSGKRFVGPRPMWGWEVQQASEASRDAAAEPSKTEKLIEEVKAIGVELVAMRDAHDRVASSLDSLLITNAPDEKPAAVLVANVVSKLLQHYGYLHLGLWYSDISSKGNSSEAGAVSACLDIAGALAQCSDGRKALRDLGLEPVLQHIEGE